MFIKRRFVRYNFFYNNMFSDNTSSYIYTMFFKFDLHQNLFFYKSFFSIIIRNYIQLKINCNQINLEKKRIMRFTNFKSFTRL